MSGNLFGPHTVADLAEMLRWWRRRPRVDRIAHSGGSRFAANIPKLVRADSSVAAANSGTFSVYMGSAGGESDTGENITAYNRGADLAANDWAIAFHNTRGWYVQVCDCAGSVDCEVCDSEIAPSQLIVDLSGFVDGSCPCSALNGTWYLDHDPAVALGQCQPVSQAPFDNCCGWIYEVSSGGCGFSIRAQVSKASSGTYYLWCGVVLTTSPGGFVIGNYISLGSSAPDCFAFDHEAISATASFIMCTTSAVSVEITSP